MTTSISPTLTFCAGEFDMRVKSCSANAENSQPIQLSDEHGCVLRPKMISKFMKIAGADTRFVMTGQPCAGTSSSRLPTFISRASVVTYAFFHAFKFPDSMAVNIKCKVRPFNSISSFSTKYEIPNKVQGETKYHLLFLNTPNLCWTLTIHCIGKDAIDKKTDTQSWSLDISFDSTNLKINFLNNKMTRS